MGVQHRDPLLGERRQRRGHRGVERAGALGAAEDQQHRTVGGQAEVLTGSRTQGVAVERGDGVPQRDAQHLSVRQAAAGHRRGHAGGEPGADLVRQPRPGVRLVHDDRRAPPGREVRGQGDVAAEPDDDVRVDLAQHVTDRGDGRPHLDRQPQQISARLARQRDRRDQLQRVAARRDEPGVEALLGAERGDGGVGTEPADGVGERHGRLDVPGGTPAGHHNGQSHRTRPAPAGVRGAR